MGPQWDAIKPAILTLAILAALLVAALSLAVTVPVFKVIIGDCAPGQQDGQCGLGTFMAYICAFGTSIVVWLVTAVKFSRRLRGRPQNG
jgi:surface polysaccharide O-acyltransferase-like enzyme